MKNRLYSFIYQGLMQNKCVILPSFGAFLLENIPASYQKDKSLFLPPFSEIRFNSSITHSDGILEHLYAKKLGVSFRKAKLLLEEDIRKLKEKLFKASDIHIPYVGKLCLNNEGSVLFVAEEGFSSFSPISYGLSPLSFSKIDKKVEFSFNSLQIKEDNYFHLKVKKSHFAFFSVCIVFIITLFIPIKTIHTNKYYSASFIPTNNASISIEKSFKSANSVDKSKKIGLETKVEATGDLTSRKEQFAIVIAAFKKQISAEKFIHNNLDLEKYPRCKVLSTNKFKYVIIEEFHNKNIANTYLLNLIKEETSFNTAWILTYEK